MAGWRSVRKTKKRAGPGGLIALSSKGVGRYYKALAKTKRRQKAKPAANPTVYDAAGKAFGKFRKSAAQIVARAIGGTVGKPKKNSNPKAIVFPSKSAAIRYAKTRGIKRYKLTKVARAK